jgi:tricarballylate dehydrogenase
MSPTRVVVVGAGNAALCAALAAAEQGAAVTVLEAAPFSERGGNTAYTAGAMRVTYNDWTDLAQLMPEVSATELSRHEFGSYTEAQFLEDIGRVTEYRCDPDLVELLVRRSFATLQWMRGLGVRFLPIYGRQAFNVDGKFTFWGGLVVEANGGGPGLVSALADAAVGRGVDLRYGHRAMRLKQDGSRVTGVVVRSRSENWVIDADAVVLACGGFEANAAWRAQYLGTGWDLARVRGTRHNTGDGLRMAVDCGAATSGHWSGCHAVQWDLNAPSFGDLEVGDGFQKHSYPFGILVNADGQRFVDEGEDFRNYTYAKYGRRVLEQPGQFGWQIFDSKVDHLLREEYRIRQVTKVTANSLEELAGKLEGVDPDAFIKTVREFNASVDLSVPFNPNSKDGRRTHGLAIDKSNWSNTIDKPPFQAYAVTCGITFTFGGLRINNDAEVLDAGNEPIPGLFACGEIVGGIFYFNYPGGSGLTSGSVFGRIAGSSAAERVGVPIADDYGGKSVIEPTSWNAVGATTSEPDQCGTDQQPEMASYRPPTTQTRAD